MSLYDDIRRSNRNRTVRIMCPKHDPCEYVCRMDLSEEMFDEILLVYENNQKYYSASGRIDDLCDLEYWFVHVIEPAPKSGDLDSWVEREEHKVRGFSYYCSDACKRLVNIGDRDFRAIVRNIQRVKDVARQ